MRGIVHSAHKGPRVRWQAKTTQAALRRSGSGWGVASPLIGASPHSPRRAACAFFARLNKSEKGKRGFPLILQGGERQKMELERQNLDDKRQKNIDFCLSSEDAAASERQKQGPVVSNESQRFTGPTVVESKEINLRRLDYSPRENPFTAGAEIRTSTKTVRTRAAPRDLLDPETGEVVGATVIHTIEERDEEHFVKVFADGVKAAFDLSKTGARVFNTVLSEYQAAKMTGGYADSLTLFFFDDGVCCRTGLNPTLSPFRPSVFPREQDVGPSEGRDVSQEAG